MLLKNSINIRCCFFDDKWYEVVELFFRKETGNAEN